MSWGCKKLLFICLLAIPNVVFGLDGRKIVEGAVLAHGGKENFYRLRDVEAQLALHNEETKKEETSKEQYVFKNEKSIGIYPDRTEMFDGEGRTLATFQRRANYFFFTLPFKWLDSGLKYKTLEPVTLNHQKYQRVQIDFKTKNDDRFVLYVNQTNQMVDQFLFTQKERGIQEPLLMKCKYEEISGIKIATERTLYKSNWKAETQAGPVETHKLTKIRFWNGL